MQISILTDNHSYSSDFLCEVGTSLFVKSKKHNVLIDTGQSDVFIKNAKKLGIDLQSVDICCLTHGHYDHCNGLSYFLELNQRAKIYASADIFGKYYNAENKYVGIKDEIKKHKDRFVFVEEEYFVDETLHMFTGNDKIPISTVREIGYSARSNGLLEPDDFHHEMYVLVGDKQKLILSGCTHKGIGNVMHWARFERVSAFVGGVRFGKFDPNNARDMRQAEQLAEQLIRHNARYCLCHCNNEALYAFLAERLGERYTRVSAGMQLEI